MWPTTVFSLPDACSKGHPCQAQQSQPGASYHLATSRSTSTNSREDERGSGRRFNASLALASANIS